MRYDPTTESFADFLTKFKKLAKKAYEDKANEIAETFLFAKLPIQIQNELAMAGKHEATSEEIKTLVQRRCQYAQLLPSTSGMQMLNNLQNYPVKQQANQQTATTNNPGKSTTNKEVKRKFEINCRYCNIVGHKWIDCRERLRDEANGINTKTYRRSNQTTTTNSPRPTNLDTTQSSCAKSVEKLGTLHETAEIESQAPQRTRMYQKQSTTENREFHRDFRQSQNTRQPPYQVSQVTSEPTQTEGHNDCYDEEYNEEFNPHSKNL